MNKAFKNYTKSDLFKLANQIRKEKHCSQKDAYHIAKNQLENVNVIKKTHKDAFKKKVYKVRITNKTKKHTLEKYNFSVGQVFDSVNALATYMNVSIQNVYGSIRLGYFESIN